MLLGILVITLERLPEALMTTLEWLLDVDAVSLVMLLDEELA